MTASKVLALLSDAESPLHVIAQAVAADVKLSYQVFRFANSAFSSPALAIESIPAAIMRLGETSFARG